MFGSTATPSRLFRFRLLSAAFALTSQHKTAYCACGSIQPIGRADPMIAAIAIDQGLELVTGNTAHYQLIQELGYPLTLVNWRL
jgi:predicted nucleic acid-binding protein